MNISTRVSAKLVLPYANVEITLAVPLNRLLNPAQVTATKTTNTAPNAMRAGTVLFLRLTSSVNTMLRTTPITFIAMPVYAPSKPYCKANSDSLAERNKSNRLCFLHWNDIILAIIPKIPIASIKTSKAVILEKNPIAAVRNVRRALRIKVI